MKLVRFYDDTTVKAVKQAIEVLVFSQTHFLLTINFLWGWSKVSLTAIIVMFFGFQVQMSSNGEKEMWEWRPELEGDPSRAKCAALTTAVTDSKASGSSPCLPR